MKDIIGLAVLTSPLFLIVPWLVVAVLVAVKAAQLPKMRVAKLAAGAATLVVVFLLPFADEIAGRIYLKHLCSTEAGVRVYQTVELPEEYWDAQGKPKFYVNQYDHNKLRYIFPDKTIIGAPQLQYTRGTTPYSDLFNIEKNVLQIADRQNNRVIGEYILFMYWGGWVARNFSPHITAASCELKDMDGWALHLFKPVSSAIKGARLDISPN